MSRRGWTRTLLGLFLLGLMAGCEPISEPWVSGEWGKRIEDERTRTDEQQRELRQRLEYSGADR